jgi:hypothetical protein
VSCEGAGASSAIPSVSVVAGGETFEMTTIGLEWRRMGKSFSCTGDSPEGTATAIVSEVSSVQSRIGSWVAGTRIVSASFFFFGVILFCLFDAVGVPAASSDSNSRFPTLPFAEPRGVTSWSVPGVSVPRRVVTMASAGSGALLVGGVSLASLERPWNEGERLRIRFAVL